MVDRENDTINDCAGDTALMQDIDVPSSLSAPLPLPPADDSQS